MKTGQSLEAGYFGIFLAPMATCVRCIAFPEFRNYFTELTTQEFHTEKHMGVENPIIQIPLLYIAIWIIFAVTATVAYAYAHLWWKQKIPKINNMKMEKIKGLRSLMDRRSGADRRKVHNIDYLLNGGIERRRGVERRSKVERRTDWVKVSEWQSVDQSLIVEAIDFKKT